MSNTTSTPIEKQKPPHEKIAEWLPHIFLLILLLLMVWLLAAVLAPLRDPLLLSMAIAAVTYPIIYKPIERLFTSTLPQVSPTIKKQLCGPFAATVLVCIIFTPVFLVLFTAGPSFSETWDILAGVVKHDQNSIHLFADAMSGQLQNIHKIYPRLPLVIDPVFDHHGQVSQAGINYIDKFNKYIVSFLTSESNLNTVFFNFLKNGSSTIAELIMTFIALAFFYGHGPRLVKILMDCTPLSSSEQADMSRHHYKVVARLLSDTIGTAIVKGCLLGFVISLLTGNSFFLIAILAGFLSLLPVIGLTMVWLPMALLAWGHAEYTEAIAIAACSLTANYGIDWLRNHFGNKIHDRDAWTSFLLFLGLVGGIISFGIKGFVLGPVVVVIVAVLGKFWLPLYGYSFANTTRITVDQD